MRNGIRVLGSGFRCQEKKHKGEDLAEIPAEPKQQRMRPVVIPAKLVPDSDRGAGI
jgi:hypothetical protein